MQILGNEYKHNPKMDCGQSMDSFNDSLMQFNSRATVKKHS